MVLPTPFIVAHLILYHSMALHFQINFFIFAWHVIFGGYALRMIANLHFVPAKPVRIPEP